MQIKCAYSGITFSCEHFPATLNQGESYHPIFAIPQKSLFQYSRKWAARELTDTDKYLLYLALLHSTELLEWRCSAIRTPRTTAMIENNMEALLHIVGKMNLVKHPSFVLSHIAITQETRDLSNSRYWIETWNESYQDFLDGYKDAKLHDKLVTREATIERLVKDANKPIEAYARHLADWAEMASEFPTYSVRVDGKSIPINEYWKNIIVSCCKEERVFLIPKEHIEKLLEHLEDNLDAGSISAHTTFNLVRAGLKKQHNYLGLGDLDLTETKYRILPNESTIQDANTMAMIDSAPVKKPIPADYPSNIAYLRARVKWDMKESYLAQQVAIAKLNAEILSKAENDPPEMEELEVEIDENELVESGLTIVEPKANLGSYEGEL